MRVDRPRHRRLAGSSGLLILALACLVALNACLPPPRPEPTPTPPPTSRATATGTAIPSTPPGTPSTAAPSPAASPATATPAATRPAAETPTPGQPTAPTQTPAAAQPSAPAAVNKRGVHLLLDDGNVRFPESVWGQHVSWARQLSGPGGYVVELVRSNDLRPESWQRLVDLLAEYDQVPIFRLATFKDEKNQWWTAPSPDPDGLGYKSEADRWRRFFDALTWKSDTVLVTVGNETNRPDEWGGSPDPAAYARYLRDVAEALRRVRSVKVLVLNGALDNYAPSATFGRTFSIDSERYLEDMAAEIPDIFDKLDGWAAHSYPLGPFGEPPGRQTFKIDDTRPTARPRRQPPGGIVNRGVNGYEWELWKLDQLGASKELPVYVTESGWRHVASQSPNSSDKEYATVSNDRFAEMVTLAYDGPPDGKADGWTPWNKDPRVKAVALFALAGRPDLWGHTNLLLVDAVGQIQGAYPFAEALARVYPGPVAQRTGTPGPSR